VRRGFTLIEVLVAFGLFGLVAAMTFAPVIYAVARVVEAEEAYSDAAALRRAALFMSRDVAGGLRLSRDIVRLIPHEEFGGDGDDTLIVASITPARQNIPAGSVVYRIVRKSFTTSVVPGLYRWVLPGVQPPDVKHDRLDEKAGQLIVPYVASMKLSAHAGRDWTNEYRGAIPLGLKIKMKRRKESEPQDAGVEEEFIFAFPR
jgi:prepilin-type N-terminal cleavage/methylation domain-containing protein